jgi:4'-phosphopantetheinyl transferase
MMVMTILWPPAAVFPPLDPGDLHVWGMPLDEAFSGATRLCEVITAEEQHRANEFTIQAPRDRFIAARAALRMLLGQHLDLPPRDVPLRTDANGKPRLAAEHAPAMDLQFNVAHSANLALIAVTLGCEVGIDVERVRPVNHVQHIAQRFFHADECAALDRADRSQRDLVFMRTWTAKEAVLKAVGSGITGSLSHFCVSADGHGGAWIELPDCRCWLQQLSPAEEYVGAVACVGAAKCLQHFAWERPHSGSLRDSFARSPKLP